MQQTLAGVMPLEERLVWLSELVRSQELSLSDRLKAMDQLGKIEKELQQRLELTRDVTVEVRLLDS